VTIKSAISALLELGDTGDLELAMKENDISETEDLVQLKNLVDKMTKIVRSCDNSKSSQSAAQPPNIDLFYVLRQGGHTITLLAPLEVCTVG